VDISLLLFSELKRREGGRASILKPKRFSLLLFGSGKRRREMSTDKGMRQMCKFAFTETILKITALKPID